MTHSTENESRPLPTSKLSFDPQGQAALLVVESLMHVLVEKGLIGTGDALDALNSAISIKHEIARRGDEPIEAAQASLVLLDRMVATFSSKAADEVPGKG